MRFPKKKWLPADKSITMIPECPEEHMQKAVNQYLELKKIDYIRIPDEIFKWIKIHTPPWIQMFFFRTFKTRPDNTVIIPIGNGIAIALLLELKTQDADGRKIGTLHGNQRFHSGEWVVCRSVNSALMKIDEFVEIAEKLKIHIQSEKQL